MGKKCDISGISRRSFITGAAATGVAAMLVGTAGTGIASARESSASAESKSASETVSADETRSAYGSASGRFDEIVAKVTVQGTTIVSIDIVKHHETQMIAASALSKIPALIIKNQSLDIDTITGATMTSSGIILAVSDALDQMDIYSDDLAQVGSDSGHYVDEPIDADVAVIGAGLAGLACAARLLQNGKKVALFEETGHVGGSAVCSAGWITGAGTEIEKENGIEDTSELFYQFVEELTASRGHTIDYPDTTKVYTEKSGEVVDWLDSYVGVDFGDRSAAAGIYEPEDINRVYGTNMGGSSLVRPLFDLIQREAANGNASISLNAYVTGLVMDNSGAVAGVEVTYEDGTVKDYPYAAVVLTTGGYDYNVEMQKSGGYANYCAPTPSTSSGHGFDLIAQAGGKLVNMDQKSTYGGGIPAIGDEVLYTANLNLPGEIWVTKDGVRLTAEDHWYDAHNIWDDAPDNIAYVLFSDAQVFDGCRPISLNAFYMGEYTPQDAWSIFNDLVDKGEYAFEADTIEDLATAAGIDPDALAKTVEAYNGYVDAGRDADFGRDPANLQKLEGKFYAVKGLPMQFICAGGVRVTTGGQVVDDSDNPIAGLYAGGEVLGLYQYAGCVRGGGGLGGAATWGYVAADTVSAE